MYIYIDSKLVDLNLSKITFCLIFHTRLCVGKSIILNNFNFELIVKLSNGVTIFFYLLN